MIKMIGQSFSIIAGWMVGIAVLNTAFSADVAEITPFISPRTIKNGSIVYPSSQAYVDLLQRSGYLFKPETENYLQHFRAPVFHALSPYYVVQRLCVHSIRKPVLNCDSLCWSVATVKIIGNSYITSTNRLRPLLRWEGTAPPRP